MLHGYILPGFSIYTGIALSLSRVSVWRGSTKAVSSEGVEYTVGGAALYCRKFRLSYAPLRVLQNYKEKSYRTVPWRADSYFPLRF